MLLVFNGTTGKKKCFELHFKYYNIGNWIGCFILEADNTPPLSPEVKFHGNTDKIWTIVHFKYLCKQTQYRQIQSN